jgi:hypothetical protein
MAIKGYIQDVKVPVSFTLEQDCVNEIIYVDAYLLGEGKIATINAIIPTIDIPNPSGLIKGAKKGTRITLFVDFSLIGNPGSAYTFVARSIETGVVFTAPMIIVAEDGYSVEGYKGNVINESEATTIQTDGPANQFLAADGNYYEVNVPASEPTDTWDDATYYDTDDPRLYEYNNIISWYASTVDDNLNNAPRILTGVGEGDINSDYWEIITAESSQPLVKYVTNTLFKQEFIVAIKDMRLYELISSTRPYFSTDFDVELAAGDWQVTGSSGDEFLLAYPTTLQSVAPSLSDFANIPVSEWNSHPQGPLGKFFDKLFPTILASILTSKYVTLSGVTTQTLEVGATISPLLTAAFNQGSIKNGDGTTAGSLVGAATSYQFRDPSNITISHLDDNPIDNSQDAQVLSYILSTRGTFYWRVVTNHGQGSTDYYDNKDKDTLDTNLSASEAAATASDNSNTVTTRYVRFHYLGDQNTSPTTSSGVRALTDKAFLSASDEGSLNVTIPSGTQEFTFYCIEGKSIQVIDEGNLNNDITASFNRSSISVNDLNSQAVSYEKNTIYLGLGGFPDDTTFQITIS